MLTAGQINNVSFKVNLMGSSSEPSVRVVLAANPDMSFTATRDGDSWKAAINVPTSVVPGSYDLRVEVVLNNRLFTPLQKKIDVVGLEAPIEVPATVSMPAPEPAEPAEPKVSLMTSIIGDGPTVEKKPAPEMPKVVGKMPKVEPKAAPKAEEVVVPPAPSLSKLAETAARPAKRVYARVVTPLPQASAEAKPITISISEVNAITSTTTKKLVSTKPIVEAKVKKNPTVRLIKEELFYE